jgi:hypothetical protein
MKATVTPAKPYQVILSRLEVIWGASSY